MPPSSVIGRDRRLRLLDRSTEPTRRYARRAEAYAHILPTSSPRRYLDPLVLLLVPTARRAEGVTVAFAYSATPIAVTVCVWSKASTSSVIAELRVNSKTDIRPTYRIARQGLRNVRKSGDGGSRTRVRSRVMRWPLRA